MRSVIWYGVCLCTVGLFAKLAGMGWHIAAVTATVACIILYFVGQKLKDPYGSFHLSLNITDAADDAPATEWLNMGYWRDAQTLPQASEALALKVFDAAGCKPGGHVLDVGHGSGESLVLQLRHPDVPRPSTLTGITSLYDHYKRSLEKVHSISTQTVVSLYHGDAVCRPRSGGHHQTTSHPLDPSVHSKEYTNIVAIDCAYHFRTRLRFLRQCYTCLAPGGRVALADICFDSSGSIWYKRSLALLGLMPRENMVTKEEYVRSMQILGYDDVQVDDISANVFPGFARFLSGRGFGWKLFAQSVQLMSAAGARFIIVSGAR